MTKKEIQEIRAIEVSHKKVAIVGFAPSWNLAPFENEEFEIWGLNELYKLFEKHPHGRAERWFEIHNPNSPSKAIPEHIDWLSKCPIPLYMQKVEERFPMAQELPLKEMIEHFGSGYLTNSISYMIAFAIYEGFREIHVYGVDMAQDSEYQTQRPSCEYWLGRAEGMGIKTYIPPTSDLLKCAGLYGYETDNQMRVKMKARIKELKDRQKGYQQEINKLNANIVQLNGAVQQIGGAIDDCNFWLKNWSY